MNPVAQITGVNHALSQAAATVAEDDKAAE